MRTRPAAARGHAAPRRREAAGVGYVTFAGINAAMLLSVWPAFQQAYPLIDPAQRASVEIAFRALTDAAEIGIQTLAYLLGGGFWILSGMLLRVYRARLGWTSIALGAAAWVGAIDVRATTEPDDRLRYVWYHTYGMHKTTVYLNDDEAEALRQLSATTGVSQAELIRAAIRQAVAKRLKRRFRSLGLGEGDSTRVPGWSSSDVYDKAFGER